MNGRSPVLFFLLCLLIANGQAQESSAINPEAQDGHTQTDTDGKSPELMKNLSQAELADIEKHYGETAAKLKKLHGLVEQKNQDLNKTQEAIQTYQDEIIRQNKDIANQLRAAYAMGKKDKLKLLFNQQDPTRANRMMVYYDYLYKARINRLATMDESLKHLDQLNKRKLTVAELLEKNKELLKAEQIALSSVRKKRDDLISHSKSELVSNEPRLNDIETKLDNLVSPTPETQPLVHDSETSANIKPTAGESESADRFSSRKGKLPWPVKGRLVQKFGSVHSGRVWDGLLISAKEGTEIHAVNDGKVVYAQWLRGYGMLIIIDHGQGFMSLYAFNQSIYKETGDTVKTGEVIASVGQSGGRSEPGLYFGIRTQGVAVNPVDWFKK